MAVTVNLNKEATLKQIEEQLKNVNPNEEVILSIKSAFSWDIIVKIFKKFYDKVKFIVETTALHHFYDLLVLKGQMPFKLVILYDSYNEEYINGERSCYKTFQSILALMGKQRFTVRFIITELNKRFFSKSLIEDLLKHNVEVEYA